eukprot:CAMPEP_0184999396 /NCGR_PEP_ID=MMETSP1098-20130426/65297_1 /TAXON_ID=89044 /ORGANISM="Spumella elongata, Strain CCAP 955/1" /LENGTH=58 /DNA_ID=CAMNT_0027526391 /DNA_START=234 /DNA_END=407 /DNA_ORIENTATION=-
MNVVPNAISQMSTFTIFRDGNELTPGKIMVKVDHPSVNEAQSVSFTFMDVPGSTGNYL